MTLPLLLSLPHAGLAIPEALRGQCQLSEAEVVADGDEGAAQIYADLEAHVAAFVTTDVARAVVDMNRAEDDVRKDGVVKTHTCWDVPIWREALSDAQVERLLSDHHRPYHARLSALAGAGVKLGIDCHTMAAEGPPVAPDPGQKRPLLCLGNRHGETCSGPTYELVAECLERAFEAPVSRNLPFSGGHIVRAHAAELPWVQLEMSRTDALSNADKGACFLAALEDLCHRL